MQTLCDSFWKSMLVFSGDRYISIKVTDLWSPIRLRFLATRIEVQSASTEESRCFRGTVFPCLARSGRTHPEPRASSNLQRQVVAALPKIVLDLAKRSAQTLANQGSQATGRKTLARLQRRRGSQKSVTGKPVAVLRPIADASLPAPVRPLSW